MNLVHEPRGLTSDGQVYVPIAETFVGILIPLQTAFFCRSAGELIRVDVSLYFTVEVEGRRDPVQENVKSDELRRKASCALHEVI